jgi:prevent-host-death family protein
MFAMDRVGIRQLRVNTSDVLRRVKSGETLELTEFGRPIARIVPIDLSRWDQLVMAGEVEPAVDEGAPLDFEPIEPAPGTPLLSEVLARMRAEDSR